MGQSSSPAGPDSSAAVAPGSVGAGDVTALEYAKLRQERELKERELALKERELDLQHRQSWLARWSTPSVVAIVAGFIGYIGTLISSSQNRQLEREKQEGTLILEAIKTTGTPDEKARQTAANLVFLADAGLITSVKREELEKLREKAQGAGPSLPAPQSAPQGVEFRRSPSMTSELQAKLQAALSDYQAALSRIGYDPGKGGEPVTVRIDEELRDNAFFDNKSVVLGVNLARDPEYVLYEYTWHVLKQTNPVAFQALWNSTAFQFTAFAHGLKYYFTCSHLNDPLVGKNFHALASASGIDRKKPYLFNLEAFRAFQPAGGDDAREEHKLGEIWGGAFWEVRQTLGKEKTDRLILDAWKRLQPVAKELGKPQFYVDAILSASKAAGNEQDTNVIRQAFARRNLK